MELRDSIVGAITAGQGAVGSALTGGGAAVANDNGTIPLLEDLRLVSPERTKAIHKDLQMSCVICLPLIRQDVSLQKRPTKRPSNGSRPCSGGGMGMKILAPF